MKTPFLSVFIISSVLVTISVLLTTFNQIIENVIHENWKGNILPIALLSIMFIISVIHIVLRNVSRHNGIKSRIQPWVNLAFCIELLVFMIYGLSLNYESPILAISCISANIIFLIIGIITLISLIKKKNR